MTGNIVLGESLKRCENTGNFSESFYKIFLEKDENIQDIFKNTDFTRQKRILLLSVKILIENGLDDHKTQMMVEQISYTHDRFHHNIEPIHYDKWLDSLCETVTLLDPECSDDIVSQWRKHLTPIIDSIVAGY